VCRCGQDVRVLRWPRTDGGSVACVFWCRVKTNPRCRVAWAGFSWMTRAAPEATAHQHLPERRVGNWARRKLQDAAAGNRQPAARPCGAGEVRVMPVCATPHALGLPGRIPRCRSRRRDEQGTGTAVRSASVGFSVTELVQSDARTVGSSQPPAGARSRFRRSLLRPAGAPDDLGGWFRTQTGDRVR